MRHKLMLLIPLACLAGCGHRDTSGTIVNNFISESTQKTTIDVEGFRYTFRGKQGAPGETIKVRISDGRVLVEPPLSTSVK